MIKKIIHILKNDFVFSASLLLALASCFFAIPKASDIDFKVLAALFSLMVVIKAFEDLKILDKFAVGILGKCRDSRKVSLVLILLSFFSSMVITNDIALLTLVPLAIIIGRKSQTNVMITVILQTLAANIGSSLTPMGNPQNLFIFSHYKLGPWEFFTAIILIAAAGLLWLLLLNKRIQKHEIAYSLDQIMLGGKIQTALWTVIFMIVILSVFKIIDFKIAFLITLLAALIINRRLLLKVDYPLLITFVCFFIFIGNVSAIPWVGNFMKNSLNGSFSTFLSSVFLSQVISNVPCAVFLAKFTSNWRDLLLGVNIGGMGTIIASLASVISYKLFVKEHPSEGKKYLLKFTVYNFLSLAVFILIGLLVITAAKN